MSVFYDNEYGTLPILKDSVIRLCVCVLLSPRLDVDHAESSIC